jgi:hypothetical protein
MKTTSPRDALVLRIGATGAEQTAKGVGGGPRAYASPACSMPEIEDAKMIRLRHSKVFISANYGSEHVPFDAASVVGPGESDSATAARNPNNGRASNSCVKENAINQNVRNMKTLKPSKSSGSINVTDKKRRGSTSLSNTKAKAEQEIANLRRGRQRLATTSTADDTDARASLI